MYRSLRALMNPSARRYWLQAGLLNDLDERWRAQVLPATGFASYDEMRRAEGNGTANAASAQDK